MSSNGGQNDQSANNEDPDVKLGVARRREGTNEEDAIDDDRKPAATPNVADEKAAYRVQLGAAIQIMDQNAPPQRAHDFSVSSSEGQLATTTDADDVAAVPSRSATANRTPGAEYVPRVAPGFNPSSVTIDQEEALVGYVVTPLEITPEEYDPGNIRAAKNHRKYCIGCSTLFCILLGVAVAVEVSLCGRSKKRKNKSTTQTNSPNSPTSFGPIVDCDFLNGEQGQPNVFSQCSCTGNISLVAPDIVDRYYNLTDTFIQTVLPDFIESMNSCSSQNQALLWLASGDGVTTESRMRQRYALALLFAAWNGTTWNSKKNWLSSIDECTWYGLYCNEGGMVTNITVANNNAVVDLSPVAALLNNVESLNVSYSTLLGNTIPSEVGLLSNLQTLDISQSGISGTLPTELFNLGDTLQYFDASLNSLSGTIPSLIGKLVNLKSFILLEEHYLTGSLPSQLGRCTNLEELLLDFNKLNGTMPTEIGSLKALRQLDVIGNDLTGTLPTELGRCTNLVGLDLTSNHLNGTVPTGLASAPLSDGLIVTGNQLDVPSVICQKFVDNPSFCVGCLC